jgi:hypothetical protein
MQKKKIVSFAKNIRWKFKHDEATEKRINKKITKERENNKQTLNNNLKEERQPFAYFILKKSVRVSLIKF